MFNKHERESAVDRWSERLLVDGYCVIPDLVPSIDVAALDADLAADFEATPFCEGRFYGERTKRMWRGPAGEIEYLVNVMWPLTRFTRENGATRLWPESHGQRVHHEVAEASEQVPELEPGSALLFLGSTLHAAGANRSNEVRRGMIAGYSLGWLKTYENQFLAYPPEIARTFPPELAALVGYRQHRPNLGNFEGCCPSVLLQGKAPDRLGARDALRPDQEEAVDAHAAQERERTSA